MSMMWPPHSVKIVSTPSLFSAFATRCPPETTFASRVFCFSVSSAVVVGVATGRVAVSTDIVCSLRRNTCCDHEREFAPCPDPDGTESGARHPSVRGPDGEVGGQFAACALDLAAAKRLQHEPGKQRRGGVHDACHDEHRMPV